MTASGDALVQADVASAATTTAAPAPPGDGTEPQREPDAPDHARTHNRLLAALLVLLVAYTCALAEAVLVPILVGILLGLIFAPAVRALERWRVPRVIGALLAVVFCVALLGAVFTALAAPAREWLARMPQAIAHIESSLRQPLKAATQATRELGKLGALGGAPEHVVDSSPGMLAQFISAAPVTLAGIVLTFFLTFLFLLHGDALLRKFVTMAPHLRAKRDLVLATREAQRELSRYMITITLINAALGVATAIALRLLHVPDPLLWGGVAAVLNYAPFIGPLLTAFLLAIAGFAEFASPLSALAAPAAFLGLHLLEGEVVTPHLVGHQLALDPVMVFLALVVLGWLWGVAGLLLAVPLMACAKIVAGRVLEGDLLATLLAR